MPTSELAQIDKALGRARRRTKADIARKLAKGLPIATLENGAMELHQIVSKPEPEFVTSVVGVGAGFAKVRLSSKAASQLRDYEVRSGTGLQRAKALEINR